MRILLLGSKRRISPESLLRDFCLRVGPCAKTNTKPEKKKKKKNSKIALFLTSINPHSSCTGDLYSTINDPRPQKWSSQLLPCSQLTRSMLFSDDEKFELCTINPGLILGPILHGSNCTSMEVRIIFFTPPPPLCNPFTRINR